MDNVTETKMCPDCQLEKPVSDFYKDSQHPSKYRKFCKICWNKRVIENRKRHPRRQYERMWRQTPAGKFKTLRYMAKQPILFNQNEFITWFKQQDLVCHYCKQDLILTGFTNLSLSARHSNLDSQLTLDRKDNDLPYMLDNIVLCCRRCNMIKGKWFSEKQMLEIAQRYF